MLNLKDFHNKHKDEDIYVIGSGPTCDYIDQSFLDGKISIGTNQTYRKYNTTYTVRKEHNLLDETIENYNGTIFVAKHHCGGTANKSIDLSKYQNNCKLCVYEHLNNKLKIDIKAFDKENLLCVSYSTITTAIHLAYHMGAKNILLIGVDHGTIDGKFTFDGYYRDIKETPWSNWQEYKNWLKLLDSDTATIAKKIRSLGVNIYSINPFINLRLEGHKYE